MACQVTENQKTKKFNEASQNILANQWLEGALSQASSDKCQILIHITVFSLTLAMETKTLLSV